jgi:hypothetical protein
LAVSIIPAGAVLAVEAAWGADLTGNPDIWAWTDITTDVRVESGITANLGRGDEASTTQPASCTVLLDNTAGKYSLGPQNTVNYPYVRRGTPIRVRVNANSAGFKTLFFGNATSWTPDWDLSGKIRTVRLEVAGTLRRLGQGKTPVKSPMRRAIENSGQVKSYWPCEDGKSATYFAPAVGQNNVTWSGLPALATNDRFDCSAPLPSMKEASFTGAVGSYTPNTTDASTAIRCLFGFPPSGMVDQTVLMRVYTTGTIGRWDLIYGTGGTLEVKAFGAGGVQLFAGGAAGFNVDGNLRRVTLEMFQSAGQIYQFLGTQQVGEYFYVHSGEASTGVSGSLGRVDRVAINPERAASDVVFGHLSVQALRSNTETLTVVTKALNANSGESPRERIERVCLENGVPVNTISSGQPLSNSDYLGPQPVEAVLEVLRDTELAGVGVLFDGISAGLAYRSRQNRESQAPAMTLTMSQLADPFNITDDDQRTRNKATVTRAGGGGAATYEDVSGPLGSAVVGLYDTSTEVNCQFDSATRDHAGWIVAQGTVVGYRYPQVTLNLRDPVIAASWLDVLPGRRIDITGISATLPGHPPETVSLMVEGVSNAISAGQWIGVAKCSPYQVWNVAVLGAESPVDSPPGALRLDGTAFTAGTVTAASTSISVTTSEPWVTTAAFASEFPFDVEIAGQKVTVTAITGASSPQTWTISATGVAGTIPTSSLIRLWQPTTLGL